MVEKLKTIKVKEETHQKLAEMGRKGDSFDYLINILINHFKKTKKSRNLSDRGFGGKPELLSGGGY